jgi:uncharacterized protein (DUF1778 family)
MLKNQRLTVRLSPGEQQEIELAAYAKGVSPSEFVRTVAAYCAKEIVNQIREENRA